MKVCRFLVVLTVLFSVSMGMLLTACDDDDDDDAPAAGTVPGGDAGAQAVDPGDDGDDDDDDDAPPPADPPALTAPALNAPANGATFVARGGSATVDLAWSGVDGATAYKAKVGGAEFDVGGTAYSFTGGPGTYNWQAAAVRGDEVVWSGTRQFTISTF